MILFDEEVEMYPVIRKHFEERHYRVMTDKPRGRGIKFKSLKGWTIDVVGVKKIGGTDLVAVEAKNSLGKGAILDAFSKAEMYRNICTRAYVAFPRGRLRQKESRTTMGEIRQECQRRGIGMLEVGQECREMVPAVPSSLNIDKMKGLMNEFEKSRKGFEGFEEEDFVRYFLEEDVAWHRFELLVKEVEKRLKKKRLILTHEARGANWWFSFSRRLPKGRRYYQVPHFTVSFWGGDGGIMTEFITREGTYLNNLRRKVRQNPESFRRILMRLKEELPCQIKIMERVHIGGYKTRTSSEYTISSQYLDEDYTAKLIDLILERGRLGKIWFWIGHLFRLSEEETQSRELIDCIEEFLSGLMELYDFVVQKRSH